MGKSGRRSARAVRQACVSGLACALLACAAGCSLELGFEPSSPLGQVRPVTLTCEPLDRPPPAKEQPGKDAAPGNNGKAAENGNDEKKDEKKDEKDKDQKPAKPPAPRTFPQAFCAYVHCLCTHGKGQAEDEKKDKEGAKEGGNNGAADKDDRGEKNPPATEGDRPKTTTNSNSSQAPGASGPKNPPAAEADQKKAAGPGGGQGTQESAPKNPPAATTEEKANGEKKKDEEKKDEEKKDEDKEKEKEPEESWYSAHAQATMVTQKHNEFPSPYIGPLSLLPHEPMATSVTGTIFLDMRLWENGCSTGELVFNPEFAGGSGFSGTDGIAGFPNGEITRVGVAEPTPYFARLFLRETWALGDEMEKVESDANQIAGKRPVDRLTLVVGKLSAEDVVDDNRYSHDPRVQFLNWSIMYNSAWDYPANVRGYTYGVALDYNTRNWAWRYGIFAEPEFANGAPLDPDFTKANGQVTEWQGRYTLNEHPGNLRLLAYLNHAHMGDYLEALTAMPVKPNVTLTRAYRFKYGCGLSWDQEITKDLGVFSRLGWSDGHTETWAFTPVDRTAVVGLSLKGRCWCRPDDVVGLAYAINGLAKDHHEYLEAGGLDFSIGDGRLRYAPEEILEFYYDYQIIKGIFVTFDFQEIAHPAYNADRGPVSVFTIRGHIEL